MTAIVFTGPTLPPEIAREHLDAQFLPPVAQGDVIAALKSKPEAIGIIDGYFQNVPSVWHKEILQAMALGVPVFGASSMGALRAAELHAFGMIGVGRIFEAFHSLTLEDDDEVAVKHGPAELGYLALSEAMVNVRCTLADAEEAGVISDTAREVLERMAKLLPYQDRDYGRILMAGMEAGVPLPEADALRAWLPSGRRDLKREDAVEMLRTMDTRLSVGIPRHTPTFHFEQTTIFRNALDYARTV